MAQTAATSAHVIGFIVILMIAVFLSGKSKNETVKMAEAKKELPQRSCGKDGEFKVPVIGVGCWSFGSNEGEYWGNRDQEDVNDIVAAALEYGTTLFDTAEAYQGGRSEESLRVAIEASGMAEKAIVVSKILPQNCFKIREHLNASLERLGLKSMYLYQVHWPFTAEMCKDGLPDVKAVFEELAALQKEGLIEHIGVSNFGVKQLTEAIETGVKIVTNQLNYSLFSRAIELEVIPLCQKHNIGVIAYSPLLQGILTDKGDIDTADKHRLRTRHFDGKRELSRHGEDGVESEMKKALAEIKEIAKREGTSVSSLAMAWVIANPAVVSLIPGARNRKQLEANMATAFTPLKPELKEELDNITNDIKTKLGPYIDYYLGKSAQRSF